MSTGEVLPPELALALRLLQPQRAEALIRYFQDRQERKRQRLEALVDEAELASSLSFDELLHRATGNERQGDLAEHVFRSASRTESERKMRALGRALAMGLADDAAIDETDLLLRALEDLELPHIRVLERLHQAGPYQGVEDLQLARMFHNGVLVMYALLKTLERHGLAGPVEDGRPKKLDPGVKWIIWDFGQLLYDRLLAVGEA
jgi:hypothetical protein